MQIEAGGKTWIVEEREISNGLSQGTGRFLGLSFRNTEYESDELQVRWVLKPDVLTAHIARELFHMVGMRKWRDARDGHSYSVHLETRPPESARRSSLRALETIRFQSRRGTVEAPWTLEKPLGLADDREIMDLLDQARSS